MSDNQDCIKKKNYLKKNDYGIMIIIIMTPEGVSKNGYSNQIKERRRKKNHLFSHKPASKIESSKTGNQPN